MKMSWLVGAMIAGGVVWALAGYGTVRLIGDYTPKEVEE